MSEKKLLPKGGGGVIFNPKIYVADIGSFNIALFRRSQFQHDLPKKRRGGGIFSSSENPFL